MQPFSVPLVNARAIQSLPIKCIWSTFPCRICVAKRVCRARTTRIYSTNIPQIKTQRNALKQMRNNHFKNHFESHVAFIDLSRWLKYTKRKIIEYALINYESFLPWCLVSKSRCNFGKRHIKCDVRMDHVMRWLNPISVIRSIAGFYEHVMLQQSFIIRLLHIYFTCLSSPCSSAFRWVSMFAVQLMNKRNCMRL